MKEEVNCLLCGKLVKVMAGKEGFTTEGICDLLSQIHAFSSVQGYSI